MNCYVNLKLYLCASTHRTGGASGVTSIAKRHDFFNAQPRLWVGEAVPAFPLVDKIVLTPSALRLFPTKVICDRPLKGS